MFGDRHPPASLYSSPREYYFFLKTFPAAGGVAESYPILPTVELGLVGVNDLPTASHAAARPIERNQPGPSTSSPAFVVAVKWKDSVTTAASAPRTRRPKHRISVLERVERPQCRPYTLILERGRNEA